MAAAIFVAQSDSEVRSESDLGIVEALAGDDRALDRAAVQATHDAYHELRRGERVSWPCPCAHCAKGREPIKVSVHPSGPTMFEVARIVWEHRRRGLDITLEKARALASAE